MHQEEILGKCLFIHILWIVVKTAFSRFNMIAQAEEQKNYK